MNNDSVSITAEEAADFEEYKRRKKAMELRSKLRSLEPTLLRKNASVSEIRNLCAQAKRISSVCVCVQPVYVKTCKSVLRDGAVGVCCAVGGNSESTLKTKLYELKTALKDGATEVEYTPVVSAIINGNYAFLRREVKKVLRKAKGKTVKINLDAAYLPPERFTRAAAIIADCGAKILSVHAEEELITALQNQLKNKCAIKAWGVETAADFRSMLAIGCTRVGSELAEDIYHDLAEE